MSDQIITSEWFVELSDGQQELLAGGDSTQSSNNFAQRLANSTGTTTTGPNGNVSETNNQVVEVLSGGQTLLSTNAPGIPGFGNFNNLGGLGGVGVSPINTGTLLT